MKFTKRLIAHAFASLLFTACAYEHPGIDPKANDVYYPMAVTAHPGGRYVYVVSTNPDLRYNAGQLSVIDLQAVKNYGEEEPADPYNLNAIAANQTKRILSFGGFPALNSAASKLYLPVRQDSVMHLFDVAAGGAEISCGDQGFNRYVSCDRAHSLKLSGKMFSSSLNDSDTESSYAAVTAPGIEGMPGEYLYVTHLGASAISVYDINQNALKNPTGFAALSLLGNAESARVVPNGMSAIAFAGGPSPMMYVGSQRLDGVVDPSAVTRAQLFFFEPKLPITRSGNLGSLDAIYSMNATAVRYLLTNPSNTRLYVLLKSPDLIAVFDIERSIDGRPKNHLLNMLPLSSAPSVMTYVRNMKGGHDWLYVASQTQNNIAIFDATTLGKVGELAAIRDGYKTDADGQRVRDDNYIAQAPYGMAVVYTPEGPHVIVSFFASDAVVVIDATSANVKEHRDIARIGSPRREKKD